jgi:hypothetical protein
LTELVIKNWTGDIIDYEKNGQVRKCSNNNCFRSAKSTTVKERASLGMDIHIKESSSMGFCTEKERSSGQMALSTEASLQPTKSLVLGSTSGQMAQPMKDK